MPYIGPSSAMKAPHSAAVLNSENWIRGKPSLSRENRPQRKLPGGSPPIVTYSRLREEELPDVYDGERADEPEEVVAEWDAVEVPPEPPLHARRRARPLVEEVRAPVDPERFAEEKPARERPPKRSDRAERPRRSTAMRLVAVVAAAAVILGVGILVYSFSATTTINSGAPSLASDGAAPGTLPADDGLADTTTTGVREIPLDADGEATSTAPSRSASTQPAEPAEAEPVNTVPVAPPVPRSRPQVPTTATVQPDFDQAAPLPQPGAGPAPEIPQTASAPAMGGDDDFIANIERTLQQSRGGEPPALSPEADQPIQLAPPPQQLLPPPPQPTFGQAQEFPGAIQSLPQQPGAPVPPADIPMLDGQQQPIQLPNDFLIDTE